VEKELRGMVDALARQANEEERLKVYNAELVMGRDDVIKELRECLSDVQSSVIAAMILLPKDSNGMQLLEEICPKMARALLAKKGSES
jgi:hypothetical protein